MRNLLALAALALMGLTSNPARAEEPTAPSTPTVVTSPTDPLLIPAPPVPMGNPGTYYVVLGSDTYTNAPGLTGSEGASYDCNAVADHLTNTLHYPDSQVMHLCGSELVRERLFRSLSSFLVNGVPAGSTVVVVWIGHGGMDPGTGTHLWATSDGSFNMYPGPVEQLSNTSYLWSGVTPSILYGEMARVVPVNTNFVFITDTARGGVYDAGGKPLELIGPSAEDFEALDMKNVYALSPTPGKSVPVGLTRQTIITCLNPQETGLTVTTRELIGCYADHMTKTGLTVESVGAWSETSYLVIFPTPVATPVGKVKRHASAGKITLGVVGGAVAVTGGVMSYLQYQETVKLGADLEAGVYGEDLNDPTLQAKMVEYEQGRLMIPVWYGVTGVGAVGLGVSLILPNNGKPVPQKVTVSLSPTGVGVAGTF